MAKSKTKRTVAQVIAQANAEGVGIEVVASERTKVWFENNFRNAVGVGEGTATKHPWKLERAKREFSENGGSPEEIAAIEKERLDMIDAAS